MSQILIIFFTSLILSTNALAQSRLNDIQVLGTHNSFKQALHPFLASIINSFCESSIIQQLDYQHLPLEEQLQNYGVRQIELDVFADPDGGRFNEYRVLGALGEDSRPNIAELAHSGFKVLHDPNLDFLSSCYLLRDCLRTLSSWSNRHPRHIPIFIHLEVSDSYPTLPGGFRIEDFSMLKLQTPLLMTQELFSALEREVLEILPQNKIISPDSVRANYPTLREGALANNWPLLEDARGKFIFVLDGKSHIRDIYRAGYPSLNGRLFFVYAPPQADDAAFVIRNTPTADGGVQATAELVRQGFMIRSRADAETVEAFAGNMERQAQAFASGAHMVSTDYITEDLRTQNHYSVRLPGGNPARCNPVRESSPCLSSELVE